MKNSTYGCYRYFLVPFDQISMSQMLVHDRKALFESIINNNDTQIEDTNDNIKYKLYIIENIGNLYFFKFSKQTYTTTYKDTGNDIKENIIKNNPFVHIIINTELQIILIQKKTTVFKNYSLTINAFKKYINLFLLSHGYEITVDQLSDPKHFWQIIDTAENVYQVDLNLKSPNMFEGITNAEEFAKTLKEVSNSTENNINLKNDQGNLRLKKHFFKSFIEYIACGGGKWSAKAKFFGKKAKTYTSSNNLNQVELPSELNDNTIKENTNKIEKILSDINKKPGDTISNDKKDKRNDDTKKS
ncbi:hypothetical protein KM800_13400 [Clostridium tyrobutyricum]|uniref:hypothetical protein n=1 Tax=Clostridium tyrobutyricum TaxID=1519 RepID=UPI001C391A6D|nr:hypothetical protein [Clostridium tyrobutyricum]MBV4420301.1 hypothetical protein [Clostridium tyrobutyricum]